MRQYEGVFLRFPVYKHVLSGRPDLYVCENPHFYVRFEEDLSSNFCITADGEVSLDHLIGLINIRLPRR